jgi:hypothetical protein
MCKSTPNTDDENSFAIRLRLFILLFFNLSPRCIVLASASTYFNLPCACTHPKHSLFLTAPHYPPKQRGFIIPFFLRRYPSNIPPHTRGHATRWIARTPSLAPPIGPKSSHSSLVESYPPRSSHPRIFSPIRKQSSHLETALRHRLCPITRLMNSLHTLLASYAYPIVAGIALLPATCQLRPPRRGRRSTVRLAKIVKICVFFHPYPFLAVHLPKRPKGICRTHRRLIAASLLSKTSFEFALFPFRHHIPKFTPLTQFR